MSKMLMQKPSDNDLRYCDVDIFNGATVMKLFYDQGINKENYIPRSLRENGWVPNKEKNYKLWWHSTNPADPSDPGIDILDYIEEVDSNYKVKLISEIVGRLSLLNLNRLYHLLKSI